MLCVHMLAFVCRPLCSHAADSHCACLQVRELELGTDMRSVNNLLEFLERVFNGGSDFNTPVTKCLERLTDAKWANSDILMVSGGWWQWLRGWECRCVRACAPLARVCLVSKQRYRLIC